MSTVFDPTSIAGKQFVTRPHRQLVVVGAGPAGLAAAMEAARLGIETMLVDENPIAAPLMGMDVPFHFGGRMDASVQNGARALELLLESRPAIAEAFDAGIDMQLGVGAWGAFGNGPTSHYAAKPLLGLADGERSWLQPFDHLIVAAGARDMPIACAGWDKPGVMGARGFLSLLRDYRAFNGRRLVVLGAGALGLETAAAAREAGLDVVAIVDVDDAPRGPAAMLARLKAQGVAIRTGHCVRAIRGATEVEAIALAPTNAGQVSATIELACDTVVLAIDVVPTIELLDVLGCATQYRADLGGYVPKLDPDGRTSLRHVFAVGDCAGVTDARLADPALAEDAGRRAARAIAAELGRIAADAPVASPEPAGDREGVRQRWLAAQLASAGDDLVICQCEEVRLRDLVGVRPPRYLGHAETAFAHLNLHALAVDGPVNQDQIKRLTRAGMGVCQGRRCREQVHLLLAARSNVAPGDIPLASYRAPVRPVPLGVLADHDETTEIRDNWATWFGIDTQWQPHWEKPEPGRARPQGRLRRLVEK
ncbi:MAG: FAD-dependent oxidoreductase [Alphaproteobacteria bacterium]|nr:FAD-dependent oxidoreductase [Alphaproteobacteria bacterium]